MILKSHPLTGLESSQEGSRDLFESLFVSSPIGIYVVQDGTLQFANPRFELDTGFSREELLGMPALNLVHPEDRERVRQDSVRMLKGETATPFQYQIVDKAGETKWVLGTIASIQYQGRRAALGYYLDVTEQKRVEEALRTSEERYRTVVENVNDGIAMSVDSVRVFVNKAFLTLHGLTDPSEVIGKPIDLYVRPEDKEEVLRRQRARLSGKQVPKVNESKLVRADGEIRTVQTSAAAVTFGGRPATLAVFRDLTDQKLAEQAVKERTHELETLLKIANLLAQPGDLNEQLHSMLRELTRVSEGFLAGLYVPDEQKKGLVPVAVVRDEVKSQPRRNFIRFGPSWSSVSYKECRIMVKNRYRPDRRRHPHLVRDKIRSFAVLPIVAGKRVIGVVNVFAQKVDNFTPERMRLLTAIVDSIGVFMEQARLLAEEHGRARELQALFEIASILVRPGTFQANVRDMLEVMNEAAQADRSGLRVVDPKQNGLRLVASAGWLGNTSSVPTIQAKGKGLSGAALREHRVVVDNDFSPDKHSPGYVSIPGVRSAVAFPVTIGNRDLGSVIFLSQNEGHFTPDRVKMLTALTEAMGVLMENARLRESVDVERAIQSRKDTFVSIASPELRTPMTALMGFSELLQDDAGPEELRKKWAQTIHIETKRLVSILDDLLNVSHIQANYINLELDALDLPDIAAQVVSSITQVPATHTIKIDDGGVPAVVGDLEKVSQVLRNLIDNAIKYSPAGGPVNIGIKHDPQNRRVVVSVEDHGIGIAPRHQKGLFQSFHRVNVPETVSIRGTGLGLYIVKSLVELMNGEVWMESKLTQGSTFFFALPSLSVQAN